MIWRIAALRWLMQLKHLPPLAAIADVAYVVGFTSRTRTDRRITWLTERVSTLRTLADHSPIALLFGHEDRGLENVALEHCTHLVAIPTDPAYPSLNLADAVLLALYELRRAPPTSLAELPARAADHTATISLIEQTLHELPQRHVKQPCCKPYVARYSIGSAKTRQQNHKTLLPVQTNHVLARSDGPPHPS